jgi:hypothetical protein
MNEIARKFKKNVSELENAIQLKLLVPARGRPKA